MPSAVPWDKAGSFEPTLVKNRQRRPVGVDEKGLALYARGLTTRDIQGRLAEFCGVEVSPALISNITDAVLEDIRTWAEPAVSSRVHNTQKKEGPSLYFAN